MINPFKVQLLIVGVSAVTDDQPTNLAQVEDESLPGYYFAPPEDPYTSYDNSYYQNFLNRYSNNNNYVAVDSYADFGYDREDYDISAYYSPPSKTSAYYNDFLTDYDSLHGTGFYSP